MRNSWDINKKKANEKEVTQGGEEKKPEKMKLETVKRKNEKGKKQLVWFKIISVNTINSSL